MSAEAFAAGIEEKMGIFSYLNFLFHPSEPDFKDYTGTYPTGLRDKIGSLTQLASMVGYDIDLSANISKTLNSMDGDDFFNMLYDENVQDNPETPGDERIRLERDQFISLLENPEIKAAFSAIATTSIGENPTLGALLAFQGNTMDFSAFRTEDGAALVDQPIADLNAQTIPAFVDDMSDNDVLAFLSDLPVSSTDENAITQEQVISMIAAGRPGEDEAIVIPPDTSIQDAIQMRVDHNDSWYTFETTVEGMVYDSIRGSMKENLTRIIGETNQDISSGALIDALSPEELHDMLSAKLTTAEGRQEVRNALAKPENIALLREKLAEMDFNTLIALMPNEMVDAEMSNAIREFLDSNGILQSIIGILHGVFEWASEFLKDSGFDKLADSLESARDLTSVLKPEAASKYQREFGNAADPNATPQGVVDPLLQKNGVAPVATHPGAGSTGE